MNPRSLRSNYTVGPKRSVGMAKWRVTATWARAQADGRSQPTRVPHAGPEAPNDPVRSSQGKLSASVFPPLPMLLRRQDRPHGSHHYFAQVSRRGRARFDVLGEADPGGLCSALPAPPRWAPAVIDIRARHAVLGRLIRETVEFAQSAARNTQAGGIVAEDKRVMLGDTRRGNSLQVHWYKGRLKFSCGPARWVGKGCEPGRRQGKRQRNCLPAPSTCRPAANPNRCPDRRPSCRNGRASSPRDKEKPRNSLRSDSRPMRRSRMDSSSHWQSMAATWSRRTRRRSSRSNSYR